MNQKQFENYMLAVMNGIDSEFNHHKKNEEDNMVNIGHPIYAFQWKVCFNLEKQIADLNEQMDEFMERATKTEGDVEKYEIELKKMFEQMVALRNQLDTAKAQASQSDSINSEIQRLTDLLIDTEIDFTEYDDTTIRRLVDCVQVNPDKHIVVTLKGGLQGEEAL